MKIGNITLYVNDVVKSVEFYEKAFNLQRAFIDDSLEYAQMLTGDSALSFAAYKLAESNIKKSVYRHNPNSDPVGFEISFETENIQEAYDHAIKCGATALAAPIEKPWGQKTAYIRDIDGITVELATPMKFEAI